MATFSRSALNNLTYKILAAASKYIGISGLVLLESVYQRCLERELEGRPLGFKAQQPLKVDYKGMNIDCGFRIDLYIEDLVIVELKSVQELCPVHEAQLLTYLKLTGAPVGLLINFNVPVLRDGVHRMLNKEHELVDHFDPTSPR